MAMKRNVHPGKYVRQQAERLVPIAAIFGCLERKKSYATNAIAIYLSGGPGLRGPVDRRQSQKLTVGLEDSAYPTMRPRGCATGSSAAISFERLDVVSAIQVPCCPAAGFSPEPWF